MSSLRLSLRFRRGLGGGLLMYTLHRHLLGAALLALVSSAQADFQSGVAAYTQGDYDTAFREFKTLAESQELPDAQNNLGVMYNTGKGAPHDYLEAAKWYRRAAEQGHVDAQNNLGALYAQGHGLPKDDIMAYVWFDQAAIKGDPGARKNRDFVANRMNGQQLGEAKKVSLATTARLNNLLPKVQAPAPSKPVASTPKPATDNTPPTVKLTPPTNNTTPPKPVTPPPAPKPAPVPPAPPAVAKAAEPKPAASASAGRHGPVATGETLWSIAKRYAGNGVSTEQMVLAIQRANPQAFATSNIGSMRVGSTLRIPSRDEALRLPAEEAKREVRRQVGG